MTGEKVEDILNEVKELDLDYKSHNYMRIKGHKGNPGTTRNPTVMVESGLISLDMVKVVKRNFMSLGLVCFHLHSILLTLGQINITWHYRCCILY